ncbi:hypothetical protein [Leptothoe spongobia]|uniref:hypothetical protein n=1 Tax=Leptothoe spongobia TaxID=2651728 RepID=UPI002DD63371|nr:hypothetical protein [Leptothoe spongobia]
MKYFFLSDGWTTGRVWEFGGLWNEIAWQRKPIIKKLGLHIEEAAEKLWLYQVEDDVLMVEVLPNGTTATPIGQVVLKRLITAEQVIEKLCTISSSIAPEKVMSTQLNHHTNANS